MVNLIWLFFKLGATSFGGPAAHIAMMEEEFVHRRKWLSREKFLDLIALTNIIPGPNSTELAIHIGYQQAGWWGFWFAGISFILPAFLIVTAVSYFYTQYASLPVVHDFLLGAKAVVLAVIVFAFERFFKSFLRIQKFNEVLQKDFWTQKQNVVLLFVFVASVYLKARGSSEVLILMTCGLMALFITGRFLLQKNELGSLFWVFFKIGSLLFGSGYVLLSFLQTEFVQNRAWLTEAQLFDAISVGQFTPGPVFTTASFIGYLMHGFPGAVVATLGIFLPAFLFVALSIPLYAKLNSSPKFRAILAGVVAGSLGLLLSTIWTFGESIVFSWIGIALFIVSLILILKARIPTAVLILVGGLISLISTKI
ncbi:chromate efflux transporter [Bdellovibrio sp. BCCA]|uniref:chromate efflux transporter n=1 Tax=Bdellovibrio sp. BCCA TaxID=3136281 RepID=UPI0030F1E688